MIRNAKGLLKAKRRLTRLTAIQKRISLMSQSFAINTLPQACEVLDGEISELAKDVSNYQRIIAGKIRFDLQQFQTLQDLPKILIESRIALGWSQKELAERADMKASQVARYELTQYRSIGLYRALIIAEVLKDALTRRGDWFMKQE